jgi:hypothetical protein
MQCKTAVNGKETGYTKTTVPFVSSSVAYAQKRTGQTAVMKIQLWGLGITLASIAMPGHEPKNEVNSLLTC